MTVLYLSVMSLPVAPQLLFVSCTYPRRRSTSHKHKVLAQELVPRREEAQIVAHELVEVVADVVNPAEGEVVQWEAK